MVEDVVGGEGGLQESEELSLKSDVSLGDDIHVTIPPAGLNRGQLLQCGTLVAFAVLGLALGLSFREPAWLSGIMFGVAGILAGFTAYSLLRALLDSTEVSLTSRQLRVTHSFPSVRTGTIHAEDFQAVHIGSPGAIWRGYFAHEWPGGRTEVVVVSEQRILHFGDGLPQEEQEWLRGLVHDALCDEKGDSAAAEDGVLVQPPERFWADLARYSAYSALGALGLLILFIAVGALTPLIVAAVILIGFSVTAAVLSYRNYRLEHVASGWHRAVVKNLATLRRHKFSATDAEGVGRKLPDFPFFGGPRRLYNVAWNASDPRDLIAFDFTSHGATGMRDGVGCALEVRALSQELISVRPRLRYGMHFLRKGVKIPGEPEFSQVYSITADNGARASSLLTGPVARAIAGWSGQGPQPWVCMKGGMVGVSVSRDEAGNDRAMREFYDYARRVRRTVERRLTELRGDAAAGPSGRLS